MLLLIGPLSQLWSTLVQPVTRLFQPLLRVSTDVFERLTSLLDGISIARFRQLLDSLSVARFRQLLNYLTQIRAADRVAAGSDLLHYLSPNSKVTGKVQRQRRSPCSRSPRWASAPK